MTYVANTAADQTAMLEAIGADSIEALKHFDKLKTAQFPSKNFRLTPRELEITAEVISGYTNREIAEKLTISQQTVKHHLSNIFDKLGVYNRVELALFALHHNIIDPSDGESGDRP